MDTTLADRIRSVQLRDQVILDALKAVKDGMTLPLKLSLADWLFEERLVFFRYQQTALVLEHALFSSVVLLLCLSFRDHLILIL